MEQLTISTPNSYKSTSTGTEMVSYLVKGPKALIEKYIKVQNAELAKDEKEVTFDDETKAPLFHVTLDKAMQVFETGVLNFSINEDDEEYVFVDTTKYKMQEARIESCKNESTKELLLNRKLDKEDKFTDLLAKNKQARLAKYIAKNPRTVKTDESAIDDLG